MSAQTNTVPKYDSGGNLTASAVTEVSGNVGIGTPNPTSLLHVRQWGGIAIKLEDLGGSGRTFGIGAGLGAAGVFNIQDSTAGGANRLTIDRYGGVGIGTSTPNAKLDVAGDISLSAGTQLFVNSSSSVLQMGAGAGGLGSVNGGYVNLWSVNGAAPGQIQLLSGRTSGGAPIQFFTDQGGGPTEKVRIDGAGNVGIGTASPSAKLHVAGDIVIDGNISAKYQDVAEWVPARGPLAPGTVVVIGDEVIEPSAQSYDTAVAGVVSPRPGLTLGQPGEHHVLVAHSGRVRVHVDASYGAVRAGDLLVTSSTPGTAMRSAPVEILGTRIHRPGTVLGKALESLSEGQKDILVLLTLQ